MESLSVCLSSLNSRNNTSKTVLYISKYSTSVEIFSALYMLESVKKFYPQKYKNQLVV